MLKGNILIEKGKLYKFEDGAKYRIYVRNAALGAKSQWKFLKDYTFHENYGFINSTGSKFSSYSISNGLFIFGDEVFAKLDWADTYLKWRIVKLCH